MGIKNVRVLLLDPCEKCGEKFSEGQLIGMWGLGYCHVNCPKKTIEEKHNMNDLIVVQVEVNGKKVPLHEISEQTLLAIRKNSKLKEVPVARTVECSGHKYLLLKMPPNSGKYKNKVVVIELEKGYVNGSWPVEKEQDNPYLASVYSYENVQVIS